LACAAQVELVPQVRGGRPRLPPLPGSTRGRGEREEEKGGGRTRRLAARMEDSAKLRHTLGRTEGHASPRRRRRVPAATAAAAAAATRGSTLPPLPPPPAGVGTASAGPLPSLSLAVVPLPLPPPALHRVSAASPATAPEGTPPGLAPLLLPAPLTLAPSARTRRWARVHARWL